MRLRKECEHGRYDSHDDWPDFGDCPGGEFLPEGALVIETESIPDGDGSDYVGEYYPTWACDALEQLLRKRGCYPPLGPPRQGFVGSEDILDVLFADALASQVGEKPICGDSQHRHIGACELYTSQVGESE